MGSKMIGLSINLGILNLKIQMNYPTVRCITAIFEWFIPTNIAFITRIKLNTGFETCDTSFHKFQLKYYQLNFKEQMNEIR